MATGLGRGSLVEELGAPEPSHGLHWPVSLEPSGGAGGLGGMGGEFMAEQPGQCWSSQEFKVNNNSRASQKNSSNLLVPIPEI